MARVKKRKASYNPFYIPSLDALKAQARQDAQAQIDAAVGALPQDRDVTDQFARTGRDIAGYDNAYITFLKQQQQARAHLLGPNNIQTDPQADAATQAQAAAAGGALNFTGIGFENQFFGEQNAAGANLATHQMQNRRSMQDALTELGKQRSAEKAKFGALYYQILNQKKQDAFNAYQAYLANQSGAAQLAAQVSSDQANQQLQRDQLNAQIGAGGTETPTQRNARLRKRDSDSNAAEKKALDMTKATTKTDVIERRRKWLVTVPGQPGSADVQVPVEYPADWTAAQVKADYIRLHPNNPIVSGVSPGVIKNIKTTKTVLRYTYAQVYNYLRNAYRHAGWGPKNSKRFAIEWLDQQGFEGFISGEGSEPPGTHPGGPT